MKSFIHLIDHMHKLVMFFFLLLFVFSSSAQTKPGNRIAYQVHQDFDDDWAFKKDSNVNAEDPLFDDGTWRRVDLPHDWSIEDLSPNAVHGPFDASSAGANAT